MTLHIYIYIYIYIWKILRSYQGISVDFDKFVCFMINIVSIMINICLLL